MKIEADAALLTLALVAILVALAPAPALGEESARPIEEVVVTARYREETAQESPTSVTAFNSVMLEQITAQDLRDVGPASPNVHIQPVVTFPNSAAIHIRGMGQQNIESTNEMRTGVSINGVFISRPIATLIDFFDVETVEVLRGPQGTTFGKNSLAGGLAVTTKRPDGSFDYAAELTGGNEGRLDFRGAIQFPIIEDKLSARISLLMQNYDGHFKNRVNGEDLNGEDIDTIRGTIVWTPTDTFEATLIGTWLEERSDAPGGDDRSDPCPTQILSCIFTEPDDGAFTVGRDALDFHNTDQNSITGIINWDIGSFTLTSVTGWMETDGFIASDFDQTEIPFFPTFRDQVHDQFSQEVRLHSDFAGRQDFLGNLELVLGLYYFEQEHELVQSFPTLGNPSSADYGHQDGESKAVFGQAIYAITEDLNLTFGIRYTDEEKEFERNSGTLYGTQISAADPDSAPSISEMAGQVMNVTGELDSDNTSIKVGLDYRINDDVMVFATYAEGFKAGEFGARASSAFTLGPTDDEESRSYEIGIKSDWMDGRLRVNATAFYTEFENLEFGVFFPSEDNPTGQETSAQNIGEATNKGFELEITAVPVDGLTLRGSLGLLDAEYDEFCADLDGPAVEVNPVSDCGGQVQDLGGGRYLVDIDQTDKELSRAPETQIYLSAMYEWNTSIGGFFVRGAGSYESEYFSDGVLNHPQAETGDFWLWDASAGWVSNDDKWRVQAWCKNCGDKEYTSGLTPTANFFNQHFWGLPRMYGLTLAFQR
ncbi:MAG TPA: TonB-dependent receptor [Pseudomonadales bacterium]|jgi:iron complex outermembrane receptor protein